MVVMDKSSHIDKCMTLLQDTNVYKPCKDLTGQIHRHVQAALHRRKGKHGKEYQWVQLYYNQLLPTGNTGLTARFYGLPKILMALRATTYLPKMHKMQGKYCSQKYQN